MRGGARTSCRMYPAAPRGVAKRVILRVLTPSRAAMMRTCMTLCCALALAASAQGMAARPGAPDPALAAAVAGEWRSPEAKARDVHRRPVEALTFWGLKPGMTIFEVQPGGASWWTEILAPYARMTNGRFFATGADLENPKLPEGARKAREQFEAKYGGNPEIYGRIGIVNWGRESAPLPA